MTSPFNIVALWCWYKGEQFHGYQAQGHLRTVQLELLKAFPLVGLTRNPVVAGRTDRGVSARMQVLSCRVARSIEPESLPEKLSAVLPADVGIHLARIVPQGFHAAWSATSKEYHYALAADQVGDLGLLQEVAALIPGTRNFRAFHFKSSEVKERTVNAVDIVPAAHGLTLRFVGQGFARYMVRMLVGGMTGVSQGRFSIDLFREALLQQQHFHCPTAPAAPLTLWEVGYPSTVDPFTAEERRVVLPHFVSPFN